MRLHITILIWGFAAMLPFGSAASVESTGVVINLHAGMSESELQESLRGLRSLGSPHVMFRFCEYQDHAGSLAIAPLPTQTPAYRTIENASNLARDLGMTFSYMPIVLLENPRSKTEWRARLQPVDKLRWQQSYRKMILKYVRLASKARATAFSLGSELSWAEYDVDFWLELIQRVRQIYPGKLFYSFNWDHLSTTAAWRKLDFLGVTGYFEVARPTETLTQWQIAARWAAIHAQTTRWASLMRKKIAYTELGYPSREGALWDPWNHDPTERKYDPEIQKRAFQGFLLSLRHTDIEGVYFYEWISPLSAKDLGYSPLGKPAQRVWKSWFSHQKATRSIDSSKRKSSPKASPLRRKK